MDVTYECPGCGWTGEKQELKPFGAAYFDRAENTLFACPECRVLNPNKVFNPRRRSNENTTPV